MRERRRLYNDRSSNAMSKLILHLPLAPGAGEPEYDFVVLRDDGQAASHGRAIASLLPAGAQRAADVLAVVPARALSWHALTLPARVAAGLLSARADALRARAVLAGALEEQLLDDADRLHFAVFSGAGATAPIWVAVCDRAWLQAALQRLEAAGRVVSGVVAECGPLAALEGAQANPGARVVVTEGMEPAQVALCTASGVRLLPLGDATVSLARLHSPLELVAEPAFMGLAEQAFGVEALAQTVAQRLLSAERSPWNLSQFELSPSRGGRAFKRLGSAWTTFRNGPQWRPVRWGLLALLVVQVAALNALAYRHNALLEQKRNAMQAIMAQTFPQVPLIVNAPVQMRREVEALERSRGTGSAGGGDLAGLLSTVASVLGRDKAVSALDYAAGELRLRATGVTDADAQSLASVLGAQGWTARLQGEQLLIQSKEAN